MAETAARRADAAALVEFFDVPIAGAFDVPPEKAIDYFKAKGLKPTFSYAEMLNEAHDHAFTVAKMMNVDMLSQVRASLDSALATGQTFAEWKDSIIPVLQSGGWWGRKEVLDPMTGQPIVAQLGSPWRLETIFRTNMQSAYAAGQWQEITTQAQIAPWLMYDAVDDLRTRPMHAAWDRKVLPVGSSWWNTHYPPNGFNCRCGVIQLSPDELNALNLHPAPEPPDDGTYTWKNPRTDEKMQIPVGLDPGFEHNSGKTYLADLNKLLAEKISVLPPDMKAAANSVASQVSTSAALKAADQLKSVLADQQAAAAIEAAKAAAAAQEANAAALKQLAAIMEAKPSDMVGAGYLKGAIAKLQKVEAWHKLSNVEKLAQVQAEAAAQKLKTETASKLSTYKKAVLEGKIPAPSLVKALKSLPEAEQAAFLAKIDAEMAAAQAAKKAAQEAAEKAAAKAAAEAEAAKQAAAAQAAAQKAVKPPKKKVAPKPAPAPAGPPDAIVTAPGAPPNPAKLVKIGEQRGSNPGGTYQDTETGAKWYIKQPASIEQVRNEVLAGKLYELAGVETPELHLITLDGKPSIASRIVDGLEKATPAKLAKAPGAHEGFAVDAWLSNWDVVGLGYDNLLLKAGRAFRVDVGGALRFRAQGGLKGDSFGTSVEEIDSLRQPTNRQAASVFGSMSIEDLERSVERVLDIPESEIRALVATWGPTDPKETALLADKLIARQRDLARRFPAAAARVANPPEPAPKPAGRVTAAEQAEVERARANGYTFTTDGDQIEDNGVLVNVYTRADGKAGTRAHMKLTPAGQARLKDQLEKVAAATPQVELSDATNAILQAVKSVNLRAGKKEALPANILQRLDDAIAKGTKAAADLRKAMTVNTSVGAAKNLQQHAELFETWVGHLKQARTVSATGNARFVANQAQFPAAGIPAQISYFPKTSAPAAGPPWKKQKGEVQFNVARFDKGHAIETSKTAGLDGTSLSYTAELPDGTKLTYIPPEGGNGRATVGSLKIEVIGKGAAQTERVFEAMREIGLTATRATEVDRQLLYLNSFAKLRLIRDTPKAGAYGRYTAITETGEAGVRKRLALIKAEIGLDVEKTEGWKTVDGVRQAFGHGRAYQLRPDLDTPEFRQLEKDKYEVYHNPNGLGHSAGANSFEPMKVVIDSGGIAAPLMDRYRRGVSLTGSSVGSDMSTGGGDYYFTRLLKGNKGTGWYWKPRALKRMDAISYGSDQFGNTAHDHILANRKGQTPASFRDLSRGNSNETIFKGGLSVFDDLEAIVLSNQVEVDHAIAWLKSRGYDKWPDGRRLDEVVIHTTTKAKRNGP